MMVVGLMEWISAVVLLWTGRKEGRKKSVSCVDFVVWTRGVTVWWVLGDRRLEGRVDDEQPKPAAEGPEDAY